MAGLLKGRRATTHWAYTDLLPLVGATYEKARVVKDGNVITGGGVTAGIDFGLSVIAEIAGETTARRIQLGVEYDPRPPFDSGHPDKAPTIKSELLSARYNEFRAMYRTRIEQAVPAISISTISALSAWDVFDDDVGLRNEAGTFSAQ